MGKTRSLNAQINYAISRHTHIGESKRGYKIGHNGETNGRIFSVRYAKNLRDTTKSFTNFMKEVHPEIRMAKDIKTEHIQAWADTRGKDWTSPTWTSKISQMQKIMANVNDTFKSNVKCEIIKPDKISKTSPRVKAMEKNDITMLKSELGKGNSQAITAIEVASRCGLRVNEISALKSENINLEKNVIEIRDGAKNGKWRDVPIRDADREYFAQLKSNITTGYITEGVKPDGLNRGIRRAMTKIGLNEKYDRTTVHSIRKTYARERMEELRTQGKSERSAWSVVQQELGHGSEFRQALYNVYIGS